MAGGTDHPWACPECRQEVDYYECGKRRDPRSTRFRSVCGDCFDRISGVGRYPDVPGSKTGGASAAAARKIARFAETLDYELLVYLSANSPIAPDDYATVKDMDVLNARPIFSRCKARGHVEKLNAGAQSKLNNKAHFYALTPAGRAVLAITQQQGEAA